MDVAAGDFPETGARDVACSALHTEEFHTPRASAPLVVAIGTSVFFYKTSFLACYFFMDETKFTKFSVNALYISTISSFSREITKVTFASHV